jgi:hypothetical protein
MVVDAYFCIETLDVGVDGVRRAAKFSGDGGLFASIEEPVKNLQFARRNAISSSESLPDRLREHFRSKRASRGLLGTRHNLERLTPAGDATFKRSSH